MTEDFFIEWKAPKHAPRVYKRMTPSAETVLKLYLSIAQKTRSTGFRISLSDISEKTGLTRITVRRGNDCLKQLGLLNWKRGYGFNPSKWMENTYVLNLPALRDAGVIR